MHRRSSINQHLTRMLGYLWASPTTAVGTVPLVLAVLTGGRVQIVRGVVEVYGGLGNWLLRRCVPIKGGASAVTLGHIVIARDRTCLDLCRAHELVHVRQCERWGPLFLPAYGIASLIAWIRGGSAYRDNAFEREAYGD